MVSLQSSCLLWKRRQERCLQLSLRASRDLWGISISALSMVRREVRGGGGVAPSFKINRQYLQSQNTPKWMYWSETAALTAAVNRYKSGVEMKRWSIRMMEGCGMSVGEAATPHAFAVLRGRRAKAAHDWWGDSLLRLDRFLFQFILSSSFCPAALVASFSRLPRISLAYSHKIRRRRRLFYFLMRARTKNLSSPNVSNSSISWHESSTWRHTDAGGYVETSNDLVMV